MADEMLGPILLTHHNLTYYQRLVRRAREAIVAGRFDEFHRERVIGWTVGRATAASRETT